MNKQMKQHLEAVLDAIVEEDTSAAKASFHEYLRLKTQAILIGEAEEEDDKEEKKDDKKKSDKKDDEEKSDKKDDDKKKSDKKKDDEDCDM